MDDNTPKGPYSDSVMDHFSNPRNMGEMEEGRDVDKLKWTAVALVGQVPVKIRGSIEHGDWIEMDYEGCGRATRSWHPDVIGRAMESLVADSEESIGVVKALLK